MTHNVGTIDRIIRAIIGIVLIIAPFAAGWGTVWTIVCVIVGIVMLGVAATRFCPLYSLFGFKTCSTPE